MHHKRGKPKRRRAGCLLCKPHKAKLTNPETEVSKLGFGNIRKIDAAKRQERGE